MSVSVYKYSVRIRISKSVNLENYFFCKHMINTTNPGQRAIFSYSNDVSFNSLIWTQAETVTWGSSKTSLTWTEKRWKVESCEEAREGDSEPASTSHSNNFWWLLEERGSENSRDSCSGEEGREKKKKKEEEEEEGRRREERGGEEWRGEERRGEETWSMRAVLSSLKAKMT